MKTSTKRVPRGLISVVAMALLVVAAYCYSDYITLLPLPRRSLIVLIGFLGLFIINISLFGFSLFRAFSKMIRIDKSVVDEATEEAMVEDALVTALDGEGELPRDSCGYIEISIGIFAGLFVGACVSGLIRLIAQ